MEFFVSSKAFNEDEEISRRSRLFIEMIKDFNGNQFLKTHFRENARGKSEFDKSFKYPDHFEVLRIDTEKFPMELLKWKDSLSNRVVLQLHGGGYVGMFKNYYRTMAGLYSEVGDKLSVLSIDYRVAPENPFPAALEDATFAYEWLLDYGYKAEDIVVAGDSAGGGLALALCHYLKNQGRELPGAIVLMSPWTDLTLSGESYKENATIDPIFGNGNDSLIFDNPYSDKENLTNPYVSPLFGDFEGFPPMLIQVGSREMLYSDSVKLADKVRGSGVKVRFTEYQGMFHVFQIAATMMPESKKAWAEVGRFLMLTKRSGML